MAKDRIDRDELASKLMETAGSAEDPLRAMAELLTDFVMEAEVTAKIGAEAHQRSEERTTHRNGYRERRWDTRLGTLHLQVPKVREGGYVPSFIEHRKRSEQALISVIQEAVVKGVSTRKIEAVLEELGIAGVSAGQVSQLCAALDEKVRKFREGPLGEIRYMWVDALYEKVRVDRRGERRRLGPVFQKSEGARAERSQAGDFGRTHGPESGGAQGAEGGMATLQSAFLSQRSGACNEA
jgi:putative transposase